MISDPGSRHGYTLAIELRPGLACATEQVLVVLSELAVGGILLPRTHSGNTKNVLFLLSHLHPSEALALPFCTCPETSNLSARHYQQQ